MGGITIPSLALRPREVDRVIDEYTADACMLLGVPSCALTSTESGSLKRQRLRSLPEIEQATLRLVALRELGTIARATARLGSTGRALARWLGRRHP